MFIVIWKAYRACETEGDKTGVGFSQPKLEQSDLGTKENGIIKSCFIFA